MQSVVDLGFPLQFQVDIDLYCSTQHESDCHIMFLLSHYDCHGCSDCGSFIFSKFLIVPHDSLSQAGIVYTTAVNNTYLSVLVNLTWLLFDVP